MSKEPTRQDDEKSNSDVPSKTFELSKLSFVKQRQRIFMGYWLFAPFCWVASFLAIMSFIRPYISDSDWYITLAGVYMFILLGIMWASLFVVVHLLGLTCPNCGADFMNFNLGPPNENGQDDALMISCCGKCGAKIVDLEE